MWNTVEYYVEFIVATLGFAVNLYALWAKEKGMFLGRWGEWATAGAGRKEN